MRRPLNIVFLGLTLSSSWGNGHATTYRSLLSGLRQEGHHALFLERDVPWYARQRDLLAPEFCGLELYENVPDLIVRFGPAIRSADVVVVGSYVPEGAEVIDAVRCLQPRLLCFYDIDTPVTLASLARGDREFLAGRQIGEFDVYFSFAGGRALDILRETYGARNPVQLYCSVDPSHYAPTGEEKQWDLGYLGTYSPDRQPGLERMLVEPARRLPDRRFVVAGSGYPAEITWPDNVERIEHIPPGEHASFYSRQRFTLNVTRSDMIRLGWSPSVRLFEAAACKTAVISDDWPGLTELFPEDTAILVARTSDDVVRSLTSTSSNQRDRIAAQAFALVAQHTGRARAREMVDALYQVSERGFVRENLRTAIKETA